MYFTICLDLETSLWAIRSAAGDLIRLLAKAPLFHIYNHPSLTPSKVLGVKTVPCFKKTKPRNDLISRAPGTHNLRIITFPDKDAARPVRMEVALP